MALACGIVGLPNVGKSTLFNALTQTAAAQAANYPFCTIEPNIGRVAVPDERLQKLAQLASSAQILPTALEFVDIAGLVRGAAEGQGLGNQFLSHIREVDAIVHVLRCFVDDNIIHVENSVDPLRDKGIIDTELALADLESLQRRLPPLQKKAKSGEEEAKTTVALVEALITHLNSGKPARTLAIKPSEQPRLKALQLLTAKPVLYVCNVEEAAAADGNKLSALVAQMAQAEGNVSVVISAAIEEQVAQLPAAEQQEYLASMGLSEPGLNRIIRAAYELLDLISYFTVGPKEARAWTVKRGSTAPQAAGVIHSDFERGFICAETIAYPDYASCGSEAAAKQVGKLRLEGKDYIVRDGDVIHFRFNV